MAQSHAIDAPPAVHERQPWDTTGAVQGGERRVSDAPCSTGHGFPDDFCCDFRQRATASARARRRSRGLGTVLAAVAALALLQALVQAQEKTNFEQQGGEEEKVKAGAADDEEDFVPEHEETEEALGPYQIRRPKYKLISTDQDPDYFGQLGIRRLSPVRDVRRAFREQARKFRDAIMGCHQPECFRAPRAKLGNAMANSSTNRSADCMANRSSNCSSNCTDAHAENCSVQNATRPASAPEAANGSASEALKMSRERRAGEELGKGEEGRGPRIFRASGRDSKVSTPTLDAFKPLSEAYRVLTDPHLKRVYEVSGVRGLQGKYKPQFQDPLRDPYKLEMVFKTGSFKMDFGFQPGQSKSTGNVHHNIKIPMIGFYTGFHMDVGIVRGELCPHCNGTGAAEHAEMLTCPTCNGAGKHERNTFWRAAASPHARHRAKRYTGIDSTVTTNCARCEGMGKLASEPCPRCGGKKTLEGKVTVTVNIEPGMQEGHSFTFKEYAEQMPGVPSGDVILHVYSEEHDDFEREGSDLVTSQNISLMEALLGFKREIKHLDGRLIEIERLQVTEPGQEHEVPGLGMPVYQKPGEFGKLRIKLNILFPERIAVDEERARELRKADERSKRRKRNRFKATDGEAARDVEDEVYDDEVEEEDEEEEDESGTTRTQRTNKPAAVTDEAEEDEVEDEDEDEEGEDDGPDQRASRGAGAGRSATGAPGAPKVGIGMFVEPVYAPVDGEPAAGQEGTAGRQQVGLVVKRLVPGGPAALSGQIMQGDMLLKVGDKAVAGTKLQELATHLLGQVGSDVVLTLQRSSGDYSKDFTVSIKRGPVTPTQEAREARAAREAST